MVFLRQEPIQDLGLFHEADFSSWSVFPGMILVPPLEQEAEIISGSVAQTGVLLKSQYGTFLNNSR